MKYKGLQIIHIGLSSRLQRLYGLLSEMIMVLRDGLVHQGFQWRVGLISLD